MRTIGNHLPSDAPPRETHARCDICGVHKYRSDMRFDGAKRIICKSHGDGLDEVSLDKINAAAAARRRLTPRYDGGGNITKETYPLATPTHYVNGDHL